MDFPTIFKYAIAIVYLIGTGIVIKFKNNKISALKLQAETQKGMLESQKGIVENAQTYASMFKSEVPQGYIAQMEKKITLEKDEAIKNLNAEWQLKAEKSVNTLLEKYGILFAAFVTQIYRYPYNPVIIHSIEEIKDYEIKKDLSSIRENAIKIWNEVWPKINVDSSYGTTILQTLIAQGVDPFPNLDGGKKSEPGGDGAGL